MSAFWYSQTNPLSPPPPPSSTLKVQKPQAAATRQYFPKVQDRLRSKIKLTPKMTAVLTGHGMTKAYLHRFYLREEATCSGGEENQSMNHILFHCPNTSGQRETLNKANRNLASK